MTDFVAKYCKLRSAIDQYDQRCRDQVAPLEKERVAIRDGLLDWMHKTGLTVVQLPETLGEDGVVHYRCIRIKKTTSQRAITPEKTKQAIMDMFYYRGPDADETIPIDAAAAISGPDAPDKKQDDAADKAYSLIRDSCTVHNENVNVTDSKRRPAHIPSEQQKLQAKMLSATDLKNLNALAETYRQRTQAITERRKHYGDAKKITREQLHAVELGVQQYLQSLPPREMKCGSKKSAAAAASAAATATQQVVLHTYSSKEQQADAAAAAAVAAAAPSEKKENHYVIALQKKCDAQQQDKIPKAPPRLSFSALKQIVDHATRRRAQKLAAAGITSMKKKDWYRIVASDVLAAIEDYYTTADAKRKKRKRLLDAAPRTATAVVMRKMPVKGASRQQKMPASSSAKRSQLTYMKK